MRIAFREAIEKTMDELNLDAIVYPTWNNKPARLDSFRTEYKGDNSQIIAPHTGQPAFTVPMGFSEDNLPAELQFLGRMYDEPTLIKLAYSYEQGTKHRAPPIIK
jgi:amidase